MALRRKSGKSKALPWREHLASFLDLPVVTTTLIALNALVLGPASSLSRNSQQRPGIGDSVTR